MIKDLISRIREKCYSLYVGLFANILIGVLVGIILYALVQLASDFYVRESYASTDRKLGREAETREQLSEYVSEKGISTDDLGAIVEWDRDNRYSYIILYDGDRIVYTTDLGAISADGEIPQSSEGYSGSGLTVDYPSFATLRRYAVQGERSKIGFSDKELSVSVADISEYFYYDIINIIAIALALVIVSVTAIGYFRRMINRIRRLEADVTIVTHSNMEHRISARGFDEISRLSSNVENMRHYILDNLRREREARESNTELITAMSHDIRTPLTVLLGYLEMMKGEAEESSVMSEYIAASEKTAMRLKQLSDDMFKYSLAFGDATEGINLEEYDAKLLFEQMLFEHVVLLREGGYDVTVDNLGEGIPEGVTVMTDAQNLMRIIDNIFSNIYKYADIAKPIKITLGALPGGRILFECVNVVRTDTYKAESNGIGLKTCRRLAGIIAESFDYGAFDGSFRCTLTMRTEAVGAEADRADSSVQNGAERRSVRGLIKDMGRRLLGCVTGIVDRIRGKKKEDIPDKESSAEQLPEAVEQIDNEDTAVTEDAPTENTACDGEELAEAACAEEADDNKELSEEESFEEILPTEGEQNNAEETDIAEQTAEDEPVLENEENAAACEGGEDVTRGSENDLENEDVEAQENKPQIENSDTGSPLEGEEAVGTEEKTAEAAELECSSDAVTDDEPKPIEQSDDESCSAEQDTENSASEEPRSAEVKPAEQKAAEPRLAEVKPVEQKAEEKKPIEHKLSEVKPIEKKSTDAKPADTRTLEHRAETGRAVNIAKAIEPAKAEPQRAADAQREHRTEQSHFINIAKAIEKAPRGEAADRESEPTASKVGKND